MQAACGRFALGLCSTCFEREGIDGVRRDIENLIKLSQRFPETTKCEVRYRWLEGARYRRGIKSRREFFFRSN